MKKIKETIMLFMLLGIMFSLQGCGVFDYFEELFDPSLMIIRGEKTISGENSVLEIDPGTRVVFKESGKFLFCEGYANRGQLIFINGAKLIANGETERITFDAVDCDGGADIFFEEGASNDSIVKYCEFKDVGVYIKNSVTINYNKFTNGSPIICLLSSSPDIEYNTFDGMGSHGFPSYGGGINSSQIPPDPEPTTTPIIKYNILMNLDAVGISFGGNDVPIIEFNNITNCEYYAVSWASGTISNNYIADCSGKTGVDTTGEQSWVTYQNPRSIPVEEAGCGW